MRQATQQGLSVLSEYSLGLVSFGKRELHRLVERHGQPPRPPASARMRAGCAPGPRHVRSCSLDHLGRRGRILDVLRTRRQIDMRPGSDRRPRLQRQWHHPDPHQQDRCSASPAGAGRPDYRWCMLGVDLPGHAAPGQVCRDHRMDHLFHYSS